VQTEYSSLYRARVEETRETTRAPGVGFVAYSPLSRGFLTGAIRVLEDVNAERGTHPRFAKANFDQNRTLVAKIEEIAAEKSCTPAQPGAGMAVGPRR